MAIRVAGTTVIDDARILQNITGANGIYDNFQPDVASLAGTVIDMTNPVYTRALIAGTTFTSSNRATGRSTVILLDISTSLHLPTFDVPVYFAGGVLPNWTAHRYWVVTLMCYSSSFVMANAAGYTW